MKMWNLDYKYRFGICDFVKSREGDVDNLMLNQQFQFCSDPLEAEKIYQKLITNKSVNFGSSRLTILELLSNQILYLKQCQIEFNKRS